MSLIQILEASMQRGKDTIKNQKQLQINAKKINTLDYFKCSIPKPNNIKNWHYL
jgi:hypothetical protein